MENILPVAIFWSLQEKFNFVKKVIQQITSNKLGLRIRCQCVNRN